MKHAAAARLKKVQRDSNNKSSLRGDGTTRGEVNSSSSSVDRRSTSLRAACFFGITAIILGVGLNTQRDKRAIGRGASSLPPALGAGLDFAQLKEKAVVPAKKTEEKPKKEKSRKVQILERLQKDPEDLDALTELCDLYEWKMSRERSDEALEDIVSCHGAVIDVIAQKATSIDEAERLLAIVSADRVLSLAQGKSDRIKTAIKGLSLSLRDHGACDAQPALYAFGPEHSRSCARAAKKLRSASAMLGEDPPAGLWSAPINPSGTPMNFQLPTLTAKPTWAVSDVPWLSEISSDLRSAVLDEWPALASRKASDLTLTSGGFHDWSTHTLLINGEWSSELCGVCPRTCGLLNGRRELEVKSAKVAKGVIPPELVVLFFLLSPGGRILPHFGTHGRLVASLGIESFEDSELIVGGTAAKWSRDEFIIFDDAFEHSVVNSGTEPRVVFSMTFIHPELLPQGE